MIGKLSGIIDSFSHDHLLLDVGGVGYKVYASAHTLGRIGQKGDPASLLIITQVREDAITLFGFADRAEQEWFRLLTSVQGVGAKAGMSILAACRPDELPVIIASQDKAALTRADGVGPKLADRILTELKGKGSAIEFTLASPPAGGSAKPAQAQTGPEQDAVSALTNLGYARTEAYTAVMAAKAKANDNEQNNLQSLIRLALKELSA